MKNHRFTAIFLIIIFLFSLNIMEANAKWDDKSDELPGMSGGSVALIVGTGVLVTGLVVYLVVKNKQKKASSTPTDDLESFNTSVINDSKKPASLYNELRNASEKSPVQLFVGYENLQMQSSNNQALSVGIRFSF